MKSALEGCLIVLLLKGDLERDTDLFNKMDPYVIFQLNDQKARSLVKDEAGKTPEWNETFSFRCREGDTLHYKVFDKDPTSDDEVASGEMNVHKDFVDNRVSYSYPLGYKGKPAGTLSLQLTFLPDDAETVKLLQSLQKELEDKKKIVKEIKADIEENLKNPPKPKPSSLLMKNILDVFQTKKDKDKEFIEESIAKVEKPYIEKIKELNCTLEQFIKANDDANLRNADSLQEMNAASSQLSLYKSLSEKGVLKVRVLELELIKEKKYDTYVVFSVDRINYQTIVAKGIKKSVIFYNSFEAKRTSDDLMMVSLFDKKSVGSDDLLGSGALDLIPVILEKVLRVFSVELSLKQVQVGKIDIELLFIKN